MLVNDGKVPGNFNEILSISQNNPRKLRVLYVMRSVLSSTGNHVSTLQQAKVPPCTEPDLNCTLCLQLYSQTAILSNYAWALGLASIFNKEEVTVEVPGQAGLTALAVTALTGLIAAGRTDTLPWVGRYLSGTCPVLFGTCR